MATFIPNVQDVLPDVKMFTPDFAFIDKMMKRKEAQYEEGFAQLNNQYNLINRDVTNPHNAKVRDEFLKTAKENLKDLSAMDLSDPSNVSTAGQVFKPFYNNKFVIGDQALTSYWKEQEGIADGLRIKDGGKYFSNDNLRYIQMQREEFSKADPSSVNEYMANKRAYNPYYDYSEELKAALKEFKPSHTKIISQNGMYIKTTENESWNAIELQKYLNATLSDKAKQQMRIEGAVRLGNDSNFLMNTYMESEGSKIPEITKLLDDIDAKIAAEKDPAVIAQLKQNKQYYTDQRTEISNNVKSIRGGDMSFLKKNAEALAFKPYMSAVVNKYAIGAAHEVKFETIGFDDVQMMYYNQAAQDRRQQAGFAHDDKQAADARAFELYKLKLTKTQDERMMPTGGLNMEAKDLTVGGAKAEVENAEIAFQNQFLSLTAYVAKQNNVSMADMKGEKGAALVNAYRRAHPEDLVVKEFDKQSELLAEAKENMKGIENRAIMSTRNTLGDANFVKYVTYKNALSKNGGNVAQAMKASGIDQATLSIANSQYDNFLKPDNTLIATSAPGFFYNKTSDINKDLEGWFATDIGKDLIGGVKIYPSLKDPNDLGVAVKVDFPNTKEGRDMKKTYDDPKTQGPIIDNLKNAYNGASVKWNSEANSFIIKGLGQDFTSKFDPARNIPVADRKRLDRLQSQPLPPNTSYGTNLVRVDGGTGGGIGGKKRILTIEKFVGTGASAATVFNVKIDNRVVPGYSYTSIYDAVANGTYIIENNTTADLDASINSK
jgi:hypothetical protein